MMQTVPGTKMFHAYMSQIEIIHSRLMFLRHTLNWMIPQWRKMLIIHHMVCQTLHWRWQT